MTRRHSVPLRPPKQRWDQNAIGAVSLDRRGNCFARSIDTGHEHGIDRAIDPIKRFCDGNADKTASDCGSTTAAMVIVEIERTDDRDLGKIGYAQDRNA